jgi:SAM-dependent MidA family methyltransferase
MTFAQFMQACLYSLHGGFYASRGTRISSHFGTAPTSHPVFGTLIARQLAQMWHLLGDPAVFQVIEVGSGDGALAHAIVQACERMAPRLAQALYYVAADYAPGWLPSPDYSFGAVRP